MVKLCCLCLSRFVNFRDNPLTLDVTLPRTKTDDGEADDGDDREMFGWEFMQMYIHETRKRAHAVLNVHCVHRKCHTRAECCISDDLYSNTD